MWKVNLKIFVAFCFFLMALTGPAAEGATIIVDDDGPAQFSSIQDAIDYVDNGDEIEVRPGTYFEAINFNGKGIRLYSRDGTTVTTIDAIGQNSSVVTCNSAEDANTILEGFTITGGNSFKGGGMCNDSSSPKVTNCIFILNTGEYGGGMYNGYGSNPTVTDCTFQDNTAHVWGGGMYNGQSSPTVTNCTFSNNTTDYDGGGMYNITNSSPTVNDCNFINNIAQQSGGGMYSKDDSNSIVSNCTFSGNEARGNTTDMGGGGMYNLDNSNPTLTNCTFSNNSAPWEGGGMRNSNSSPKLTNCLFSNNTADWGGGMYNYQSNPMMTNCTFSGNIASDVGQGGGMLNYTSSSPTVSNCILWGNIPEQIVDYDSPDSTTIVLFSDVQGGWSGPMPGNIDADPLFVDAAGGDLRLISSASPCVDTGNNSAFSLPATDLVGNPRIVDGDRNGTAIVDMGAYEFQSWLIHNITQDNWYETIQAAIDDATNGDVIEVAPGTYYEAINFNGKAVRLYSTAGPNDTTIDGTGNHHVVQCISGEGANTILEGFTITGGTANGGSYPNYLGGGMYNSNSSPTVTNCTFSGNSASWDGGGMYNYQSSPTLTNCTFIGNTGSRFCGGMHNYDNSNPTVTNCTFKSNGGSAFGGGMSNLDSSPIVTSCNFSNNTGDQGSGMYNENSYPTVTNCEFLSNEADLEGGGMYNYLSSPMVTNCTFRGNSANGGFGGGGMYNEESNPRITNCTLIDNAALYGGGMSNYGIVTNCILWGNAAMEGLQIYGSAAVTYSDVEGGWGGTGNIDADPCFVDAAAGNLRMRPNSPCIDAGNTTAVPLGISLDLDGNPRILDDPQTPDTGLSILGVAVDMGAYEFHPCPIAGDINCNGVVDFKDLAILCGNWLAGTEPEL